MTFLSDLRDAQVAEKTNLRTVIISSALDLISECGFHGTSTQMIASKSRVGVGSIYRYFKSKDDLIKKVFIYVDGKISGFLLDGITEYMPVKERFVTFSMQVAKYFVDNPVEYKFLEQYYHSPYGFNEKKEELFLVSSKSEASCGGLYKTLFEAGVAEKSVKDLPLNVLCSLTLGPILYLLKDHVAGFFILEEITLQKTIEASWASIKTEEAR